MSLTATITITLPTGPEAVRDVADAAWTLATTLGSPEGLVTARDAQWVHPVGPVIIDIGDYRFLWSHGAPASLPATGHPDGNAIVTKRTHTADTAAHL